MGMTLGVSIYPAYKILRLSLTSEMSGQNLIILCIVVARIRCEICKEICLNIKVDKLKFSLYYQCPHPTSVSVLVQSVMSCSA